jgi:hypothetical protein
MNRAFRCDAKSESFSLFGGHSRVSGPLEGGKNGDAMEAVGAINAQPLD